MILQLSFQQKKYVCIEQNTTSAEPVYCGVPKELILGLFLFSIFINDLSDYIEHYSVFVYVDDTVLFVYSVSKQEIESDIQNLLSYFREC